MMRELRAVVSSQIYDYRDLDDDYRALLFAAARVRRKAQAPYSRYFVGAAVKSQSGKIYAGCNVERCSWTQTTHAEQNAIDSMVAAEGPTKIEMIALVGAPEKTKLDVLPEVASGQIQWISEVPVPCGHCLQIIWENCFGDGTVEIVSLCPTGEVAITTIASAFPMRFGPNDLGVDYSKPATK